MILYQFYYLLVEAMKITFDAYDQNIITTGDQGLVHFFSLDDGDGGDDMEEEEEKEGDEQDSKRSQLKT